MIKIFVSTLKTQGQRTSDFCFVPAGEPVSWPCECDTDGENIDGGCGCRRSMAGLKCLKATTTFEVAEVDMTEDDFLWQTIESKRQGGWLGPVGEDSFQRRLKYAIDEAKDILHFAVLYPVGVVLERRGIQILRRKL